MSEADLATSIFTTAKRQAQEAGFEVPTENNIGNFISQVSDIVTGVTSITGATGATGSGPPPDLSTVVDTTGSDNYPGKSFFTGSKFSDSFCKSYTTDSDRNNKCSVLTTENCNQTDCCIVLNGSKCVAGDAAGPIFTTDPVTKKDIDYAYYSYKNECYGSCGKGLSGAANPCSGYASSDTNVSSDCLKRLWKQTKCPNQAYVSPALVASLQNNSKVSIQVKWKDILLDEPNYADCYGADQSKWPVPCYNTKDTDFGISTRCMKRLFKDAGCTYPETIDDAYSSLNSTKSKAELVKTFSDLAKATDDTTGALTKCYGPDEFNWPDPCAGVEDTANALNGTLPKRCAKQIYKQATGCLSDDFIDNMYSELDAMTAPVKKQFFDSPYIKNIYSKTGLKRYFTDNATKFTNNRFKCYGVNPNLWPNGLGIIKKDTSLDPCKDLGTGTIYKDITLGCINRLKLDDVFPFSPNCPNSGNATVDNNFRTIARSVKDTLLNKAYEDEKNMMKILSDVEEKYYNSYAKLCPVSN
jgi:hypothetical protein